MPKQIWHSPCFVEFVEDPEEKRLRLLLEWAEYLLHKFAALGDKKAMQILSELPTHESTRTVDSPFSRRGGDSNP